MKIKRDGFFPYVTVPQVRYVKIPVPEVVRRVVQNRFTINGVSVPLATDCDGTLLSVAGRRGERTTMETSPVRGPVISLIRKGVDFAVISNSGAEDVAARFTDPLLSIFENHGEPQHMARVSVYTNGGALRWFFDDKGRVIQEGKAEY